MTRPEILDAAKACVCGQREQDYGKPEDNFETIGLLWAIYLRGVNPGCLPINGIRPVDVAAMMGLLKTARIAGARRHRMTPTTDSFVDLAGYAACAGEIAGRTRDERP